VSGPLVTIGVICYRQGRYLDDALASVAAQDYPHLEVIVVDDGSDDGSADVAREVLARRGIDALLVDDGENRRLGHRLNQVLELAHGQYVVWLAADDQLQPGAVTALVAAAEPTTGVVFGDLSVIDEQGRSRGYARPRDSWQRATALRYRERAAPPLPDMFRVNNFVPGGMALIDRKTLREAGGYDPEARTEDFDMWLRIGWTTPFRYAAVPAGLYRVVPGSTSRSERVNTLDQARIMGNHWPTADRRGRRGYARLAAMRWALAVGRGRGRSAVSLRDVARESGIPYRALLREAPAAAARPIAGAISSAVRLAVLRARRVRP
jgi:alpha-1,3-rhamnosyltransferase